MSPGPAGICLRQTGNVDYRYWMSRTLEIRGSYCSPQQQGPPLGSRLNANRMAATLYFWPTGNPGSGSSVSLGEKWGRLPISPGKKVRIRAYVRNREASPFSVALFYLFLSLRIATSDG